MQAHKRVPASYARCLSESVDKVTEQNRAIASGDSTYGFAMQVT
jgi:hypothetical protein